MEEKTQQELNELKRELYAVAGMLVSIEESLTRIDNRVKQMRIDVESKGD